MTSRRDVLRGAGVCLALPWLETLWSGRAHAQALAARRRLVVMFFPNGTALYWQPTGEGAGDAWQLSPILEPIGALKAQATVLTNVENYSPFGTVPAVEPSHAQLAGAFLTCTKCAAGDVARNGVSADQVVARALGNVTPFPSLQVGLSTLDSGTDGRHPANSRSVSWASPTEPLYKTINPQALFDRLTSSSLSAGSGGDAMAAARRRALRKSALDYVLENAATLQKRVGASDRARLDQFQTSVRDLERRVLAMSQQAQPACMPGQRPPQSFGVGAVPSGYDRGVHADVMIDLVVMALACDLTRVVSFMLDDERSDFSYSFLPSRKFTATGSVVDRGTVGAGYHGLQHAGDLNNGFATITHWNVQKGARLAGKLAAIAEGDRSVLDSSVVYLGSGMRGGDHHGNQIPSLYFGSGGGTLRTNQHVVFKQDRRLADVYLTFMRQVFRMNVAAFANSREVISEIAV